MAALSGDDLVREIHLRVRHRDEHASSIAPAPRFRGSRRRREVAAVANGVGVPADTPRPSSTVDEDPQKGMKRLPQTRQSRADLMIALHADITRGFVMPGANQPSESPGGAPPETISPLSTDAGLFSWLEPHSGPPRPVMKSPSIKGRIQTLLLRRESRPVARTRSHPTRRLCRSFA